MAAILGYAELMQERFYEPQDPKSLDALARIRSNGTRLLGLINGVLDIAKIEAGQFNLNLAEYALENVECPLARQVLRKPVPRPRGAKPASRGYLLRAKSSSSPPVVRGV